MELKARSAEAAEAEIGRFIERRSRKGEVDAAEQGELGMESTRRFYARQREENRWAWIRHFDRMAANHAKLSEDYQRRAEKLCQSEATKGEAT